MKKHAKLYKAKTRRSSTSEAAKKGSSASMVNFVTGYIGLSWSLMTASGSKREFSTSLH
jgi:hypothetical protein